MTRIASLPFLFGLLLGCGGSVIQVPSGDDGGFRHDGGHGGGKDRDQGAGGGNPLDASQNDDFPVFHEDACADSTSPPPPLECDPLNQSTCPFRQACYPIPPQASDGCHPGRYSTRCLTAGSGTQGSPCNDGTECAAGFICVKAGSGDQCVKLCRTNQFDACADGRVCREIDVTGSGWGGCE
jgi:hypothetical protein